jgi:hypothetical protein
MDDWNNEKRELSEDSSFFLVEKVILLRSREELYSKIRSSTSILHCEPSILVVFPSLSPV